MFLCGVWVIVLEVCLHENTSGKKHLIRSRKRQNIKCTYKNRITVIDKSIDDIKISNIYLMVTYWERLRDE